MSTTPLPRPFLVQRGIHLVPAPSRNRAAHALESADVYKVAAVGAALFLVFTIC